MLHCDPFTEERENIAASGTKEVLEIYASIECSKCRVEFRVPSVQIIERIIEFIGARYKQVKIHEENSSTYIPPESINLSDACWQDQNTERLNPIHGRDAESSHC
jgi:hypothetical protein